MLGRSLIAAALLLAVVAAAWTLLRPERVSASELAGMVGDPVAGEAVFNAAGCAGCHAAPGAAGEARLVLAGGHPLVSEFGTFHAPNISPDPVHGVGAWSDAELVSAIRHGTGAGGEHLYPSFPYAAYGLAETQDVLDLVAYMRTLPASDAPSLPHEIAFPFNVRALIGGWKLLFLPDGWAVPGELPPDAARGRYIAEALAHCGECHTPRNALGGLRRDMWLAGAPNPSGRGRIPDIRPASLKWSQADIAGYLATGFTPEFDTAGGSMVEVIESISQLPPEDIQAIAAYIVSVPDGPPADLAPAE